MKTKKLLKQICAVLLGLVLSVSQIPVTGYIPVSAEEIVATVTYNNATTEYTTLDEALYAMIHNDGSTLTLQKDVIAEHSIGFNISSPDNIQTYTIDLNGYGILLDSQMTSSFVIGFAGNCVANIVDSCTENRSHYIVLNSDGRGIDVKNSINEVPENDNYVEVTGGYITGGMGNHGCGIYAGNGCTVNIENINIVGNVADNGGGIFVEFGAIVTMNGGIISQNKATYNGGGVYIKESTFTMTGGEITENAAVRGGGVYVNESSFTMEGGEISNNTAKDGGGVYVYHIEESFYPDNKATFKMTGGKITGNKAEYDSNSSLGGYGYGGGIYGLMGSSNGDISKITITMEGGEISNNTATYGGGVYVETATFKMTDGKITGNKAEFNGNYSHRGCGGGVYGNNRASITIGGGIIGGTASEGNTAIEGGGVCIYNNSTITMTKGTISGNTATYGGGIFVGVDGIFTMKGGKITGNRAEYDAVNQFGGEGGGVYDASGKTGTMTDGEISENTALIGGGVFIKNDNTEFAMSGGKITGNEAVYNENLQTLLTGGGGGVTVSDSVTFTMTGGEITENAAACGGGVNVSAGATFKMTAGKISKNTAEVDGGVGVHGSIDISSGVAVIGDLYCTFIMEGGEISENIAKEDNGGVGVYGSKLKIIGNVSIKDNKLIKTDYTEEDSNLLVGAESEFSISGELTGNIGASLKKYDLDLSEYFLANGELATAEGSYNISADDAKVFTSDNKYCTVVLKDDGKLYYEKSFVVAKIPAMRYTEKALVPDVSVSGISGELTENTDYTVTISQSGEATTPVNPGKYSVEVKGTGVEYYGTVTTEFEVKKRENQITKAPVANNFDADGTEKALASAGEAAYGDIVYAVTEATAETTTPVCPEKNVFTKNIPTVKEAGKYCLWYMAKEDEFNEGTNADYLLVTVSKPTSVNGEDNSESGEDNNLINGGENNTEVDGNNNSVNEETNDTVNQGNNDSKDVENENSENGETTSVSEEINNNTSENGEGNKTDQADDDDNNYSSGGYSGGSYVFQPADNNYAVVYNTSVADKKDESKDGDSKDNAGKDNTVKDNDKPKDQNQVGNNEPQVTEVVSNDGKSETVERITSFENGDKLQESTTVKETKKGTVTVAESKLTNEAGDVIEESKSKIRENDDVTISSSKTVNYVSGVVESTYQKDSENVSIDRVKQTDLNGELIKKTEEVVKQLANGVQTKDTVWNGNGSMKSETKTEYKDGSELLAKYIQKANGKANYSRVKTDANGDVISELACKVSDKGNATITAKTPDADGNLVIPNTLKINGDKHPVTRVAANAFANNTDITSAVIGANVTKIGDGAFSGAINLEKITFKGQKTKIGEGAFKGVINLTVDVQLKNKKGLEEAKKKYIEYIEALGR